MPLCAEWDGNGFVIRHRKIESVRFTQGAPKFQIKMEESAPQPKMSFAAAIRAALTKKTAAEQTDTVSSKKAARKISGHGPAAITARPQRRNASRGG